MNYPVIVVPWLKVQAMAIYPFILVKKTSDKADNVLMQHELIHLTQQLEMLVMAFYSAYLSCYLFNLIRFRNHDEAYRNIIFELEAYAHEHDNTYLCKRSLWAFLNYR